MSGGTTNFQIENVLGPALEGKFGGVFCKDDLAGLSPPKGKIYVINLADRGDQRGTHWVLVSDLDPKQICYFDSFGISPPLLIQQFMSRAPKGKRLVYSDAQYQDLSSDVCGEFCVFCALLLFRGFSYLLILEDILDPNDIPKNESLVKNIIRRG